MEGDSAYLDEGTQGGGMEQKILRLMQRLDKSPAVDKPTIAELKQLLHKHSMLVEEKRARFDNELDARAFLAKQARKEGVRSPAINL